MDPAVDVLLPAKRPAADQISADSTLAKKPRSGFKKVAEAVLLLSAMAEMRAGRSPTQAEMDVMAEARAELAAVCAQTLAPKDLAGREAIAALIEDLGLREQKTGFRPPKLSIAEKLLMTKKKMEEKQKIEAQTASRLQASSNKPHSAISGVTSSIGHSHAPGPTSGSSMYLHSNDGKPRLSSGMLGHTGTSSSFSLQRSHYGGPRPVSAGSSFDHGQTTTSTWSVQPQTLSFSRHGNEHKMSMTSNSGEAPSGTQTTRDQATRPYGAPVPTHQYLQGQSLVNNHNEISKTVHKLLQKQFPERPTWTPPSRDYMSKAVTCQVCQSSVNDVESVLLCDACEHAYHFRCLQPSNQKVVPRGEWHCPKCLQLSNGKPLPPKYGRVTRNVSASKVPSKVTGFQTTSDQKANMQKVRTVDPQAGSTGNIASSTRTSDRRALQVNNTMPTVTSTSAKSYFEECFSKNTNQSGIIRGPVGGSTDVSPAQGLSIQNQSIHETKSEHIVKALDTTCDIPGREPPSSGLTTPTDQHSAKIFDVGTNIPEPRSESNDLSVPDSAAKSSITYTDASGSRQSSNSVSKTESASKMHDSDAHVFDQDPVHGSSMVESVVKLTAMTVENSGHKRNTSVLPKQEHVTELSNTIVETADCEPDVKTISTFEVTTNLSGLGKDHLNSDLDDTSIIEGRVNVPSEVLQVPYHNKETLMSNSGGIADNGITCVTTGSYIENISSTEDLSILVDSQNGSELSENCARSVELQGGLLKAVDDKQYFQSCCVDGVSYQLHDHALFIFDGKLVPSRLQAMWKDVRSGEKCLLISRCYFPNELPDAVVRASAPQMNEVYESDHELTIMAASIKGPCKVLPPDEFKKESEKKPRLGIEGEAAGAQRPVYVCNWHYNKSDGKLQMPSN